MLLSLLLLVCLQDGEVPPPAGVKVANEHLFLHTEAGTIVIALYPEVAPKHVAQLINLFNAGVYTGTCFPRIERNFVLQLSSAEYDRQPPLPSNLKALVKPLPAEFSKIKHERGIVSMAHKDKDVNSATTSFSILLGPAPHLDGKYTVVGHVAYGMDVVDELAKAPLNGTAPQQRIRVLQGGLATTDQLLKHPPEKAQAIFDSPLLIDPKDVDPEIRRSISERHTLFSVGLLLVIICLLIGVFVPRLSAKQLQTLNLTAVLIAAFLMVAINFDFLREVAMTNTGYVVAIALFFGLLGVFRLMSSFESAS